MSQSVSIQLLVKTRANPNRRNMLHLWVIETAPTLSVEPLPCVIACIQCGVCFLTYQYNVQYLLLMAEIRWNQPASNCRISAMNSNLHRSQRYHRLDQNNLKLGTLGTVVLHILTGLHGANWDNWMGSIQSFVDLKCYFEEVICICDDQTIV